MIFFIYDFNDCMIFFKKKNKCKSFNSKKFRIIEMNVDTRTY